MSTFFNVYRARKHYHPVVLLFGRVELFAELMVVGPADSTPLRAGSRLRVLQRDSLAGQACLKLWRKAEEAKEDKEALAKSPTRRLPPA